MNNGSRPNGHDDPKVASLDEARRRRDAAARATRAAEGSAGGGRSGRDVVVGGLLILAALGMIVAVIGPLVGFNVFQAQ